MSLYVAKLGDIVDGNGFIVGPGHPTVRLNGIPLAKAGDRVTPHSCCGAPGCQHHCVAVLLTGSAKPNILVNGQPIIVQTDFASCGDIITTPVPVFQVIAT